MSPDVKRPYDSARRRAVAAQTRQHVIDTAKPLFIEHGYESTSMRQLADAAGVSLQTLYNAFSSKYGVFSALVDVIVAGDHEPVAIADRLQVLALDEIRDPRRLVEAIVAMSVPILVRLAEIFPTLRAAASSDAQVATAFQRFAIDARYEDVRRLGTLLADLGALTAGYDAARAADVIWTTLSPDTYHLLVDLRGWSADEFESWAVDSLARTLLRARRR